MPPTELDEPACETALPPELGALPALAFALPPLLVLPPGEPSGALPLTEQAITGADSESASKHVEKRILHG
jgi:hypothetical protein